MAQSEPPRPPSGILPSNVESLASTEAPARSRSTPPLGWVLLAILMFVAGVAVALLVTAPRPGSPTAASSAPTQAPAAAQAQPGGQSPGGRPGQSGPSGQAPLGQAPQSQGRPGVPAPSPAVNGISCDALESTIFHIHVHLAVFFDGEEQQIPFGIGIAQPWQVSDSDEGPFVDDGACFYWMHTQTEDGIIHIEAPVRRPFTLGDFFAIWQQPLSASQVGPKQGQVIVYVNGQRDQTNPPDIRLLPHQRIQLDVGVDVPPYQFDFPPGD